MPTNRIKLARRRLDFYETPKWQTHALRRRVNISGSVFECCVGDGSLSDEFDDCEVYTNDIDATKEACSHFDAAIPELWSPDGDGGGDGKFDWCVTNPPFNRAFDILQCAFPRVRLGVIFLLRLSFLEPTEDRSGWLSQHPPVKQITLPRWCYKPNAAGKWATDSVTTGWFAWTPVDLLSHDTLLGELWPPFEIVPKGEMEL